MPGRSRLFSIILLGLIGGGATLYGTHQFTDVPPSAIYHNAVEWLVNRGVTQGCTPTEYCPDSPVTRAQMALFLNRAGIALSPTYLSDETILGAVDIDAAPVVCQTGSYTPTFPQVAWINSWVSLNSSSPGVWSFITANAYSTNGGASWFGLDGAAAARAGSSNAGQHAFASNNARLNLVPGTAYLFGVQTNRAVGTIDPTEGRCETVVQILNRNPGSAPFAPDPLDPGTPDADPGLGDAAP